MTLLALQENSVFAGRYRVSRCIAMGGMGAVYEVVHVETERRRALKVMLPHIIESAELRDRFRNEARVAAQVESEHIVDVSDAGIDEQTGMPFMVMELLRGEEIGKRLERVGRLDPAEALLYLEQTARALDKTHRASIVHRDLKPANLFLTIREDGRPHIKILDFGIAKLIAEGGTSANATRSLGTPLYMSPEQFRTGTAVFPAADIYALGMLAFRMLTGFPYWLEESRTESNVFAFALLAMHGPQEPATARAARQGVRLPGGFDEWFQQATVVDPKARFPTAGMAVAALISIYDVPRSQLDSVRVQVPVEAELVSNTMQTPTLHKAAPPPPTPAGRAQSPQSYQPSHQVTPPGPVFAPRSTPTPSVGVPPPSGSGAPAGHPMPYPPGFGGVQPVAGVGSGFSAIYQSGSQAGAGFSVSQPGPAPGSANRTVLIAVVAVFAALLAVGVALVAVLRPSAPTTAAERPTESAVSPVVSAPVPQVTPSAIGSEPTAAQTAGAAPSMTPATPSSSRAPATAGTKVPPPVHSAAPKAGSTPVDPHSRD